MPSVVNAMQWSVVPGSVQCSTPCSTKKEAAGQAPHLNSKRIQTQKYHLEHEEVMEEVVVVQEQQGKGREVQVHSSRRDRPAIMVNQCQSQCITGIGVHEG